MKYTKETTIQRYTLLIFLLMKYGVANTMYQPNIQLYKNPIQHKKIHTHKILFLCAFCDKNFSQKQHLIRHNITVHSEEKPYECTFCHKKFNRKENWYRHEKEVHLKNKSPQLRINNRNTQVNIISGTNQLQNSNKKLCLECNKSVTHLSRHKRIHTGEKKYQCNFCPKSFIDCSNYQKHQKRVHVNPKPHTLISNEALTAGLEPLFESCDTLNLF